MSVVNFSQLSVLVERKDLPSIKDKLEELDFHLITKFEKGSWLQYDYLGAFKPDMRTFIILPSSTVHTTDLNTYLDILKIANMSPLAVNPYLQDLLKQSLIKETPFK